MGLPAISTEVPSGSSADTIMLRARTCGSLKTAATSLIGPQGHAGGPQAIEPRIDCICSQSYFDLGPQLAGMLGAIPGGSEARVAEQIGPTDDTAQCLEQGVVAGGDDKVPVGCGVGGERCDRGMTGAKWARDIARGGVTSDGVLEDGHLAVEHRHVDMLAGPRPCPVMNSTENAKPP